MFGDINNDGWPDIYVSNDFSMPDYLYINNKNGTFTEQVKEVTKQTAFYGMGVDIADFNNDLLLDIIQMDMAPGDNRRSKANMGSMNPDLFWGTVNAGFGYQYMQNMLRLNNGTGINDGLPDFSNISRLLVLQLQIGVGVPSLQILIMMDGKIFYFEWIQKRNK